MSVRDGPFHPLRIDPKPCDAETLRQHLESFIQSFVRPDRRERAAHIVFRLAPKRAHRLGELHQMLDERHTWAPKEIGLPEGLPEAGVYYEVDPRVG